MGQQLKQKHSMKNVHHGKFDLHTKIYKWFQLEFDFFGRASTKKQTEYKEIFSIVFFY